MSASREWFKKQVRIALGALYDPRSLRGSALVTLFDLHHKANPAPDLQAILLNAIEALRPAEQAPAVSKAWRLYQILRKRYTEQFQQPQAARDIGLSVRQMQREESLAREVLVDSLWVKYRLDEREGALQAAMDAAMTADQGALSSASALPDDESEEGETPLDAAQASAGPGSEIEFLRASLPVELVQIGAVIDGMLDLLGPLLRKERITFDYQPLEAAPPLFLQEAILKQGLLEIVTAAMQNCGPGQARLAGETTGGELELQLTVSPAAQSQNWPGAQAEEKLQLAKQFIELCAGSVQAGWSETPGGRLFRASIRLPVVKQIPVLVIDDNADTQQLYRRYLAGSRYHLLEARDPQTAFALLQEFQPGVIVLDVMMPGKDGWAILGQLREHPPTRSTPVIIATILQQKELALALGAADFLHKPVSRTQFLAALNAQRTTR